MTDTPERIWIPVPIHNLEPYFNLTKVDESNIEYIRKDIHDKQVKWLDAVIRETANATTISCEKEKILRDLVQKLKDKLYFIRHG